MAMSMELEVSDVPRVTKGISPVPGQGLLRLRPERWFLSETDRQYIRALVILGYREEAGRLVQRAYERRLLEVSEAAYAENSRPLFTLFDVEYLEMMLIVGQRKRALEYVLGLMDNFELAPLANTPAWAEARDCLQKEYEVTIHAIEVDGRLPPESDGAEERSGHSILGRLVGALLRRRRPAP